MMRALEDRVQVRSQSAVRLEDPRRTTDLDKVRALVRLVGLTECPARELVRALRARLDGGISLEMATERIVECWQNKQNLFERDEFVSPSI
jgi:hypothetical protein